MIGGGVHFEETSDKCVQRELFEESGINASVDHLAVVCEMKILDHDLSMCKHKTDDGEGLVWLPIEEIRTSNIKPTFIKHIIVKIISSKEIIHLIEDTQY